MILKHSIAGRIIVGKVSGFIVGGISFLLLPVLGVATTTQFNFGLWLLLMLMGVMIGFMGVFTTHPLFNFRLPFYLQGAVIGGSFFALLPLLSPDQSFNLMQMDIVRTMGLTSSWWLVIDGMFWGILVSGLAKLISGEGNLPVK